MTWASKDALHLGERVVSLSEVARGRPVQSVVELGGGSFLLTTIPDESSNDPRSAVAKFNVAGEVEWFRWLKLEHRPSVAVEQGFGPSSGIWANQHSALLFFEHTAGRSVPVLIEHQSNRIRWIGNPSPYKHVAISPAGFLLSRAGYGFSDTVIVSDEGDVSVVPVSGAPIVTESGDTFFFEENNQTGAKTRIFVLARDGRIDDGPAIPSLGVSHPCAASTGEIYFAYDGVLFHLDLTKMSVTERGRIAPPGVRTSEVLIVDEHAVVGHDAGLGTLYLGPDVEIARTGWPSLMGGLRGNPVID